MRVEGCFACWCCRRHRAKTGGRSGRGSRVQGPGSRVQGPGSRVQGESVRVKGGHALGLLVPLLGEGRREKGAGFKGEG